MRRHQLIILLVTLGITASLPVNAGPSSAPNLDGPETDVRPGRTRYVCLPSLMWRYPELCPSYGPGDTAYRISSIQLPNPLPELPVQEIEHDEEDDLLPYTYAIVRSLPLNVYRHPMEAAAGLPPVRTMLSGSWWVSLMGTVEYDGQLWYQINPDEFVRADGLALAAPSHFQGVYLTEQPSLPFAWTNQWVRPSVVVRR